MFSLPINLLTINQFFGTAMGPAEARAFLEARRQPTGTPPETFEQQALHAVGPELYRAFFEGYTRKQWGRSPTDLPAAVFSRLPVRFTYDDRYFAHRHQGIPEDGYTEMVRRILDHPLIALRLSTPYRPDMCRGHGHLFWSGPLDGFFDHRFGRLAYRTLDFHHHEAQGDHQGCPVMNYADPGVPFTRITEHKHFAPWEQHTRTVYSQEFSRDAGPGDIPYYPVRLLPEKAQLKRYAALAKQTPGVTFLGRLGTYRYLDMDQCIAEALATARCFLRQGWNGTVG
ncbi:UDP-galactopyranose mutase [Antarctobacter sp.]|uniref:UDP-galactopyranose/dTDP-fucopyranose mutase family protein n=1 Tax=Antarctobacter sp. TaxID=1872577 RepID=UPI003A8E8A9C